jgi:anti-anti-sigma factor
MTTDGVVLYEDSVCRIERSIDPVGLRLYGSLDIGAHPVLERELGNALREGHDLYVDLSDLEFITVGCMRTFMDAAAYLEIGSCRLVLLGPSPTVRLIIAICQESGTRNVEVFPCPTSPR